MRRLRLCLLCAICLCVVAHYTLTRLYPSNTEDTKAKEVGNTWAILVAGGHGWGDYSIQASVCLAYQLLKAGGIADEKIIVFMKDDIANHPKNPQPGFIKHQDYPYNVYEGVPKDYTDSSWTIDNLRRVLLYGNRTRVKGGSGKVLNSNSNDTIFFFFVGHGVPKILKFGDETLNDDALADIFEELHKLRKYKSMVAYVDACFSGSMFVNKSALYKSMNIYVMTSTDHTEMSRRTRDDIILRMPIGSYFCVAWILDSWMHNRNNRSLQEQYEEVRKKVASAPRIMIHTADIVHFWNITSHVTKYGQEKITNEPLSYYHGYDPRLDKDIKSFKQRSTSTSAHFALCIYAKPGWVTSVLLLQFSLMSLHRFSFVRYG